MEELIEILMRHEKDYPDMKPVDAVCIVYQNEYGPGKAKDNIDYEEALKNRYYGIERKEAEVSYEAVGNDYIRVKLESLPEKYIDSLAKAYALSVQESIGSHYYLAPKLYKLIDMKLEGHFNFSVEELEEFLLEYETIDYPQPEHSSIYKEKYGDLYCVVDKKHFDF